MRIRTALALTAIVGLTVASLHAQAPAPAAQGQSLKGVVLKGKAPVSKDILKVTLPKPQEFDLPNGLHVIVLEDHRLPLVTLQMSITGAGGYYDPADHIGLASFTASLMREGTTTKTSAQISQQLETIAASVTVSAGLSSQSGGLSASCLTENLDTVMAIASDVLLNPAFSEEEIARYKTRTKASLLQQRSSPGFLASERYSRVIYGDHPGGRSSPTAESVDKTTRASLVEFHKTHYLPDFAVVGIVGDITPAEARKKIEGAFGAWKKGGLARPVVEDPAPIGPAGVYLVNRPGSVQSSLSIGTQAISRTSPDYDVVRLLNEIIGGGPTGRLFLNLREDKGWTYGAYSGLSTLRYRGDWTATAEVRTDVTEGAIRETLAEIAGTRDQPLPLSAVQDKQRLLVASFALSLESPQGLLSNYVTSWLYRLPADYWDKYPDRVMAVTPAALQAAAKKYLDASRLQIVVVGDGSKITEALKKFGPLQVYDTEGKKVSQ